MVSYHYARQKTSALRLPMMVDSGGFASLFDNATVRAEDGLGFVTLFTDTGLEYLRPSEVLEFQEQHADVAFTLDFPIPPGTDAREAQHRQELTIANAKWAIENRRRRDLPIYGCIQGWNEASYLECAATLAEHAFDGLAIGGLVPRAHDSALVLRIVEGIRAIAPTVPLHVFGLGRPGLSRQLFEAGADSVDSSSYVKLAADGRSWSDPSLRFERADADRTTSSSSHEPCVCDGNRRATANDTTKTHLRGTRAKSRPRQFDRTLPAEFFDSISKLFSSSSDIPNWTSRRSSNTVKSGPRRHLPLSGTISERSAEAQEFEGVVAAPAFHLVVSRIQRQEALRGSSKEWSRTTSSHAISRPRANDMSSASLAAHGWQSRS